MKIIYSFNSWPFVVVRRWVIRTNQSPLPESNAKGYLWTENKDATSENQTSLNAQHFSGVPDSSVAFGLGVTAPQGKSCTAIGKMDNQ